MKDKNNVMDIAIIGMAIKIPQANSLQQFWNIIVNQIDTVKMLPAKRRHWLNRYINTIPCNHRDKIVCPEGAYIENIEEFDNELFHITPKESELLDPNQRIFLHAITAHMNNPRRWHKWDTNIYKLPSGQQLPKDLDWDTWLGVTPYHEYNKDYHLGQWRCWYDFGMGALGDWGAHILDTAHEFLELGLPYEVTMQYAKGHNDYFFPYSSTILFRFPQRKGMPPVDITWYDGLDNLPPIPAGYGVSGLDPNIPVTNQGDTPKSKLNPGKIIYTKDLIFKGGSHGSTLSIIPEEKAKEMADKLPKVPKSPSNHFENFLLACNGIEKTRSPFEINGVLSQVFSLGVMAQRLNTQLFFDPRTKQITNNEFANAMLAGLPPRKGWDEFYKL